MSEEKIDDKLILTEQDIVYTTGAFLKPIQIDIDGEKQWRWVVIGFEDSSFLDGEDIGLYDYADNIESLVKEGYREEGRKG